MTAQSIRLATIATVLAELLDRSVLGNKANARFRLDDSFMKAAADGKL